MKKASFVLDTNIWISAIITNSEAKLVQFIIQNKLTVYICPEMILELQEVLKRSKFKKYLSKPISEYILIIENSCLNKTSPKHYDKAPDKDDNYLYDVCIDTKSTLVTGDKLLLNYISNPPVVTISRNTFFEMY
jgi:putative PIN family toxin of toxin-antitoxin system